MKKKIDSFVNNGRGCRADVIRDYDWGEFIVNQYVRDPLLPGWTFVGDYHTDDKKDAISTAVFFVNTSGKSHQPSLF